MTTPPPLSGEAVSKPECDFQCARGGCCPACGAEARTPAVDDLEGELKQLHDEECCNYDWRTCTDCGQWEFLRAAAAIGERRGYERGHKDGFDVGLDRASETAYARAIEDVHDLLGREPDFYRRGLDKIDDAIRALSAQAKGSKP